MNSLKINIDLKNTPPKWIDRYYEFKFWINDIIHEYIPFCIWIKFVRFKDFFHTHITCRLNPRQRWLTKQIPNYWVDKPSLIEDVLYAIVIHFVEKEKCFEVTDWVGSGLAEEEKQLKEVYDWAKTGRNDFLKKIDDAGPKLIRVEGQEFLFIKQDGTKTSYEDYLPSIELKKEFDEYDRQCLTWIVNNRKILWT